MQSLVSGTSCDDDRRSAAGCWCLHVLGSSRVQGAGVEQLVMRVCACTGGEARLELEFKYELAAMADGHVHDQNDEDQKQTSRRREEGKMWCSQRGCWRRERARGRGRWPGEEEDEVEDEDECTDGRSRAHG